MSLTRPRLLARAARAGASLYRRERDLRRLLPSLIAPNGPAAIIEGLRAAEAACEQDRQAGATGYSVLRHVGLLSALLAEGVTGRSTAPA